MKQFSSNFYGLCPNVHTASRVVLCVVHLSVCSLGAVGGGGDGTHARGQNLLPAARHYLRLHRVLLQRGGRERALRGAAGPNSPCGWVFLRCHVTRVIGRPLEITRLADTARIFHDLAAFLSVITKSKHFMLEPNNLQHG